VNLLAKSPRPARRLGTIRIRRTWQERERQILSRMEECNVAMKVAFLIALYSSRKMETKNSTTRGRKKKLVSATLAWSLKIDTAPSSRRNSVNYRNPQWELAPQDCHSRHCVGISHLKDKKSISPLILDDDQEAPCCYWGKKKRKRDVRWISERKRKSQQTLHLPITWPISK
jgi:hypothetical protein